MNAICAGFVPHAVKLTRCKRCFRELSDHTSGGKLPAKDPKPRPTVKIKKKPEVKSDSVSEGIVRRRKVDDEEEDAALINKRANRRSRETKTPEVELATGRRRRGGNEDEPGVRRIQVLTTEEVDRSQMRHKVIPEASDEVTSPDVEFILKVKASTARHKDQDDTSSLCATETTETTETTLTFQDAIEDLQNASQMLSDKLQDSEAKIVKLESEKTAILKSRIKNEKDDAAMGKMAAEMIKIRTELNKLKTANEEARDENKVLKLEAKELQGELDKRQTPEMVKATLNQVTAKLHQTESLCEELMEENKEIKREISELEEEIDELQDNFKENEADEYRDLRRELESTSKNCRILQFKMKKMEKRTEELEEEKLKLEDSFKSVKILEADKEKIGKMQDELKLAKDVSKQLTAELEELKKKHVQKVPISNKNVVPNESSQLMRDLYDAIERENDLKEQLKFAEEEGKTTRRKISSLEQENESLLLQVRKMAQSKLGKHPREEVVVDENSPDDLRLQLELNDEEMSILRKKFEEIEAERDNLKTEVNVLKEKVPSPSFIRLPSPDANCEESSDNCKYHEHQIRVLQNESKELRRKLIERDRDNDRLKTEVEVLRKKGSKVMVRSRSLDGELQIDLKRQLQLVEQEVLILRQKSGRLESENEQLNSGNRRMTMRLNRRPPSTTAENLQVENLELKDRIEELQNKVHHLIEEVRPEECSSVEVVRKGSLTDSEQELILSLKKRIQLKENELAELHTKTARIEIENNKLGRELKKLKDRMISVKRRDRRKVRDDATRMDLKEVIQELEEEISDLYIALRGRETIQETLQESVDRDRREMENAKKDLEKRYASLEEKWRATKEEKRVAGCKLEEAQNELRKIGLKVNQKKGTASDDELQELKEELENKMAAMEDAYDEKIKELAQVDQKVSSLSTERDGMSSTIAELKKHVSQLEAKDKDGDKDLESKLKVAEGNVTKLTEAKAKLQAELDKARKQIDDNKNRLKSVDNRQTEVAVGWLKERDELKNKILDANDKYEKAKDRLTVIEKEAELKEKDLNEKVEEKVIEMMTLKEEEIKNEMNDLKSSNDKFKAKSKEQEEIIKKNEREVKDAQERSKRLAVQQRKDKEEWQKTESNMESEVKSLQRKNEKLERDQKYELTSKDEELLLTKDKLVKVERDLRRLRSKQEDATRESEDKIKVLDRELTKERQEYEDLTAKYDMLEEDYVVVKAKLIMDKENIENDYLKVRDEHQTMSTELRTIRDTFNARQDVWIKEKLDNEEKIKELSAKVSRSGGWEVEKSQIKDEMAQNSSLIESYKKEEKHLKDEREALRRQVEDQSRIMGELQRMATRTSQSSSTDEGERIVAIRREKEQMVNLMGEEIQTMQKQIMAFQKERDEYKEKLEAGLKARLKINSTDSEKVSELQYEINYLEEQLAGSRLDINNMRTEYSAEKTKWSIEVAELKTKLNQFEEQNLIDGLGRSSRMLVKTKLELAWDKERSEQLKLLAESKRLITNLGDKLIKVETLRDKERLAAKTQLQSLKSTMEGEQGDTKKKIWELHGGLKDGRQSYGKKPYSNEDQEKEEMRDRLEQLESHNEQITDLIKRIEILSKMAPEALEESDNEPSTGTQNVLAPYRGRPPLVKAASEDSRRAKDEFHDMLHSILRKSEEIKKVQSGTGKQSRPYRRTLSATDKQLESYHQRLPGISSIMDSGNPYERISTIRSRSNLPSPPPSMFITPPTTRALYRKSMSLQDQSTNTDSLNSKIWHSNAPSEAESTESLVVPVRPERKNSDRRRRSVEGDKEDGTERRSRRNMKDRIKSLVSTKSIEDSGTARSIAEVGKMPASVGMGSETPEERHRDKSLTAKIRNVFRKPSSRSSSIDRESDKESRDKGRITFDATNTRSKKGKLEAQSSVESVASTTSATLKPKKKSFLNQLTSSKRSWSIDIPS